MNKGSAWPIDDELRRVVLNKLLLLLLQATGVRLGLMLQSVATIGCGVVIGFIYSWKFALFILGIMPFMMVAFGMQVRLAKGFASKHNKDLEGAGKVRHFSALIR